LLNFVDWTEHDEWNREDWTDRVTIVRARLEACERYPKRSWLTRLFSHKLYRSIYFVCSFGCASGGGIDGCCSFDRTTRHGLLAISVLRSSSFLHSSSVCSQS
jgi:hypothetical protein